MLLPFIVPTVLSTFAWRWMFDPTFSVLNWLLFHAGFITTKLPFLSDGTYGMWCAIVVNTWRGMPFFAITLLAGLQTISTDLQEAGVARRRQRLAALLARDVAAPEAGHPRGRRVLGHSDVLGLPAHLRADGRRAGQRHPPSRDVRLSDRRRHRSARRGRRDLAVHAAGALHRRLAPAPLPAAPGRAPSLGHRAPVEEVGVLLHPADRLHHRHAVPVLLDADHRPFAPTPSSTAPGAPRTIRRSGRSRRRWSTSAT